MAQARKRSIANLVHTTAATGMGTRGQRQRTPNARIGWWVDESEARGGEAPQAQVDNPMGVGTPQGVAANESAFQATRSFGSASVRSRRQAS